MNVLIIEDERPAADRLKRLLRELLPDAFFHGHLDTVKSAIDWLDDNPAPDLIFLDIHLADGLSFEIFRQREILTPVIFCTAYDQYAIQAFKLNSIDYLLKPIDPIDLEEAVSKFKKLSRSNEPPVNYEALHQAMVAGGQNFKTRFIIRIGDQLKPIDVLNILAFYSENKGTFIQLENGKNYPVDYSLDQLETLIDPSRFFRINRKFMIALESIEDIRTYSSSRLKIKIRNMKDNDILVSRDRVNDFKQWLDV